MPPLRGSKGLSYFNTTDMLLLWSYLSFQYSEFKEFFVFIYFEPLLSLFLITSNFVVRYSLFSIQKAPMIKYNDYEGLQLSRISNIRSIALPLCTHYLPLPFHSPREFPGYHPGIIQSPIFHS